MVGRTRLYRSTGSPLVRGYTSRRRRVWPWVLLVLVVAGSAGYWGYITYLR